MQSEGEIEGTETNFSLQEAKPIVDRHRPPPTAVVECTAEVNVARLYCISKEDEDE